MNSTKAAKAKIIIAEVIKWAGWALVTLQYIINHLPQ
jgi:hypothetical protein